MKLWAALPLLTACAHVPGYPGGFARLVDDYFEAKFAFEPSSATANGLHHRDAQLEDRSGPSIAARIARLKQFVGQFESIRSAPHRRGPDPCRGPLGGGRSAVPGSQG